VLHKMLLGTVMYCLSSIQSFYCLREGKPYSLCMCSKTYVWYILWQFIASPVRVNFCHLAAGAMWLAICVLWLMVIIVINQSQSWVPGSSSSHPVDTKCTLSREKRQLSQVLMLMLKKGWNHASDVVYLIAMNRSNL
jgi:hypothetical protein